MGLGCLGQLPGMGGVNNSQNFILNCNSWKEKYKNLSTKIESILNSVQICSSDIAIAPVTGAEQNIGYTSEQDFYLPYFTSAYKNNIDICVGDGAPDEKLKFGIEAVEKLNTKAYFVLKPYPNDVLFKRIVWIGKNAKGIGIDIDAYNIVTMRNQVHLEKKSLEQLEAFRKKSGMPLIIKGVFSAEDIELCKTVKPEIIVVSNHGGRVETETGSSADFLETYGKELKNYCSELWVDGGIRCAEDIKVAKYLGADKVLIARPVISALCKGGVPLAEEYLKSLIR